MKTSSIINLAGASAIVAGVFSPLISGRGLILGALTYASQKPAEGYLFIGLAAFAAVLFVSSGVRWFSVVAGVVVLADAAWNLNTLLQTISSHATAGRELGYVTSWSPGIAFTLLIAGSLAMILSAFLTGDSPSKKSNSYWDRSAIYTDLNLDDRSMRMCDKLENIGRDFRE